MLLGLGAALIPDGLPHLQKCPLWIKSATGDPRKKSFSNNTSVFGETIQSRNTRPNLRWLTPLWKKYSRRVRLLIWAGELQYQNTSCVMYVINNSKLQQPVQIQPWRPANVSHRRHNIPTLTTLTQDDTQEALLYVCHFLWKQSYLGNMQQTQAWPHSRTGNAPTVWRQ